jgi:hypothetical protein
MQKTNYVVDAVHSTSMSAGLVSEVVLSDILSTNSSIWFSKCTNSQQMKMAQIFFINSHENKLLI